LKVGKKGLAFKGIFILLSGLVVNYAIGYILAYYWYGKLFKIEGFVRAYNEFVKQPKLAFNVLIEGQTHGKEIFLKIHELYFDYRFQIAFWSIYLLVVAFRFSTRKVLKKQDASDYGSHGTARWASQKEIKEHLMKDDKGFILGEYKKQRIIHPMNSDLNQIISVFGGSGAKKSTSIAIPNILYNSVNVGSSLIVTDPKGELYNITSEFLRDQGYEVLLFNLLDMKKSLRYNPVDYVENTEEALRLSNMIISNTDGNAQTNDPMWKNAEMAYYAALMMYLKETRPKEEQHIKSILQFGTKIGRDEDLLDEIFDSLPDDSEALEMYNIFRLAQDKTRAGILIGFGVRLKLWVSKNVANLTAKSDFNLNQLGNRKTALFLLIPDNDSTYDLLPGLLIDQAFQELYKQAGMNDTGALEIRVRCILDEIANISTINNFERKVSSMRSRGISVVPIFQSITQFANRYDKDRWSEILSSSDTIVFLGTNDQKTAKYFSEKLGKTTLLINGITETSNDRGDSETKSHNFIGKPLLSPDELEKFPRNELIVFQSGRNPIKLKKHLYYKQNEWRDLKVINWTKTYPDRTDDKMKIFNPFNETNLLDDESNLTQEINLDKVETETDSSVGEAPDEDYFRSLMGQEEEEDNFII